METDVSLKKCEGLIEIYPNDFTSSLVDEFRTELKIIVHLGSFRIRSLSFFVELSAFN
jgi:hypothetical protein